MQYRAALSQAEVFPPHRSCLQQLEEQGQNKRSGFASRERKPLLVREWPHPIGFCETLNSHAGHAQSHEPDAVSQSSAISERWETAL